MKHWYVLAYDIRERKRLSRTHYFLSKRALALQNSTFLVHENKAGLNKIINGIDDRVNTKVDDVRLYPITQPNSVWASGKQSQAMSGLYFGKSKSQKKKKPQGFFTRLLSMMEIKR